MRKAFAKAQSKHSGGTSSDGHEEVFLTDLFTLTIFLDLGPGFG